MEAITIAEISIKELQSIFETSVRKVLNESKPSPEAPLQPQFLYSIAQLSEFLGCSPVTAQKLKNSGRIRYRQFGRKLIFNTLEVLEDISKTRPKK